MIILNLQDCTLYYNTLQYCTVQYTALHYSTVLYNSIHYTTLLYCTIQYCTLHYCTLQYCTLHYCTVITITIPDYRTMPIVDWFPSSPHFLSFPLEPTPALASASIQSVEAGLQLYLEELCVPHFHHCPQTLNASEPVLSCH